VAYVFNPIIFPRELLDLLCLGLRLENPLWKTAYDVLLVSFPRAQSRLPLGAGSIHQEGRLTRVPACKRTLRLSRLVRPVFLPICAPRLDQEAHLS